MVDAFKCSEGEKTPTISSSVNVRFERYNPNFTLKHENDETSRDIMSVMIVLCVFEMSGVSMLTH